MNRILASLSTATLIAAAATAQCGTLASPGTLIGAGDDTLFTTAYPLGFTFTMAGSAGATTWTHFKVCTNGWIALCDSTGTLTGCPTGTSYGSVTAALTSSLYGLAGSNPRIAPYWGDLYANTTVSPSAGVYYDNTTAAGVSCTITWNNVYDYTTTASLQTLKSFQAKINASGTIEFTYASGMNLVIASSKYVGISASNGAAVATASDFAPGPNGPSAGPAMHEVFTTAGSLDLGGKTITFVPSGTTWSEAVTCSVLAASNTNYGSGCYSIPADTVYSDFADALVASTALNGNALGFTPAGNGYIATWIPGGSTLFQTPGTGTALTPLATSDDGDTIVTLPAPMTVPGGTFAQVTVSHNGIVTLGAVSNNSADYTPTGAEATTAAGAAFYSWHDFNDTDTGSGTIKTELFGNLFCITWDSVESWPTGAGQVGTQQFQLDLATGQVNIVWTTLSSDTTSTFGSAYTVGYKGIGATANNGSVTLSSIAAGPYKFRNVLPMALAASPAPVSTPSTGTLLTYTQSNIPEAVPSSGVYFGITILSVGQNLAGTDMGFLGMPGCNLHVNSLDVTIAFVGVTDSQTTQFQIPAAVPYGFQLFAQSAALIAPNSLPNGQNAFGATLSNGVASFISFF